MVSTPMKSAFSDEGPLLLSRASLSCGACAAQLMNCFLHKSAVLLEVPGAVPVHRLL